MSPNCDDSPQTAQQSCRQPGQLQHATMPDLTILPQFPQFAPIAKEHRDVLKAAFQVVQSPLSEFTWAYQWVWGRCAKTRLSQLDGAILFLAESMKTHRQYLLQPLTVDTDHAARIVREVLSSSQRPCDSFERIPRELLNRLQEQTDLIVTEQPDRADYVYLGDDLRELPGRSYHGKRNHIRRFRAVCANAEYREMDGPLAERCASFCSNWFENHPNRELPSLQRDVNAAVEMLAERQSLGLTGGVMLADQRVLAFALGEPINRESFVIRMEKADTSLPGAYQVINQEFARHAAAGFKWINREQDVGLPGLRRAKQSYHPHHLIERFEVKLA